MYYIFKEKNNLQISRVFFPFFIWKKGIFNKDLIALSDVLKHWTKIAGMGKIILFLISP